MSYLQLGRNRANYLGTFHPIENRTQFHHLGVGNLLTTVSVNKFLKIMEILAYIQTIINLDILSGALGKHRVKSQNF